MIAYGLIFHKRVAGSVRVIPYMNESAGTKGLIPCFPPTWVVRWAGPHS